MLLFFLIFLLIEFIGAAILRGISKEKFGAELAVIVEGSFYLAIGFFVYSALGDMFFENASHEDERLWRDVFRYCGIIDMVMGGVMLLIGVVKYAVMESNNTQKNTYVKPAVSPEYSSFGWKCKCGYTNPRNTKFCGVCGEKKPEPKPVNWVCACGHINPVANKFCGACGKQAVQVTANYNPMGEPAPAQTQVVDKDVWICGNCGKRNLRVRTNCWFCDCSKNQAIK